MKLVKIGRSVDNTIVVKDDTTISRNHAEIFQDDEGNIFLTDLNSSNGTYVNGKKLKELRKENARFWKDVMLEDINAIEGMQDGRNSPVYNGGNFSPVMDQPTHQFHKWVANSII